MEKRGKRRWWKDRTWRRWRKSESQSRLDRQERMFEVRNQKVLLTLLKRKEDSMQSEEDTMECFGFHSLNQGNEWQSVRNSMESFFFFFLERGRFSWFLISWFPLFILLSFFSLPCRPSLLLHKCNNNIWGDRKDETYKNGTKACNSRTRDDSYLSSCRSCFTRGVSRRGAHPRERTSVRDKKKNACTTE